MKRVIRRRRKDRVVQRYHIGKKRRNYGFNPLKPERVYEIDFKHAPGGGIEFITTEKKDGKILSKTREIMKDKY